MLNAVEMGELKSFGEMAVIPLFLPAYESTHNYLVMKEALEEKLLVITELSHSGSVNELRVINNATVPVLLIDGEELIGAKQNRIVNTTILLKEKSETVIPVSCTEQGRWSYNSQAFEDSNTVMKHKERVRAKRSVSDSLAVSGMPDANQGEIWENLNQLQIDTCINSPTSAMKDVFNAHKNELKDFLGAFPVNDAQGGLFVFINGRVAGFEVLSRPVSYGKLHAKLLKSYAMEALVEGIKGTEAPSVGKAKAFIEQSVTAKGKKYPAVGLGNDYRIKGENLVGSGLVHREETVHTAFFRTDDNQEDGTMTRSGQRARFRI
jgi:ARG and Rhodanese-Phosphatase-superfamily-associated Protein domain